MTRATAASSLPSLRTSVVPAGRRSSSARKVSCHVWEKSESEDIVCLFLKIVLLLSRQFGELGSKMKRNDVQGTRSAMIHSVISLIRIEQIHTHTLTMLSSIGISACFVMHGLKRLDWLEKLSLKEDLSQSEMRFVSQPGFLMC